MSTTPTFSPALVGQTESAFGAILDRELAGTGLTPPLWIALNLALAGGGSVTVISSSTGSPRHETSASPSRGRTSTIWPPQGFSR